MQSPTVEFGFDRGAIAELRRHKREASSQLALASLSCVNQEKNEFLCPVCPCPCPCPCPYPIPVLRALGVFTDSIIAPHPVSASSSDRRRDASIESAESSGQSHAHAIVGHIKTANDARAQ